MAKSKFKVIVADPPWSFGDKLTMSDTKRGSESNYSTMNDADLADIDVQAISANDAVLALWCPSALLEQGIFVMGQWGFNLKQTHIWVKTKKQPFKRVVRSFKRIIKHGLTNWSDTVYDDEVNEMHDSMDMNDMLAFGMGRLFRQAHEICLIGTRGKTSKMLQDKSQRSVHFAPVLKHSSKPEALQDMLDKMFPRVKKLELFARRDRKGWTCVGLECPSTLNEDVRDSIERLQ
jgi:N6-adenosine-specific RNA methylase IME4